MNGRPEIKNPFVNGKIVGFDVKPEVYHVIGSDQRGHMDFVMSRGSLAKFIHCPSKWLAGSESKDTEATKWGSLLDTLVLTPEQLNDRFAVYPDTYPCEATAKDPRTEKPWNNNATFCKEWKAEREGRIFIRNETMDAGGEPDEESGVTLGNALRAKSRMMADKRLRSLIHCSESQVMVTAEYHDKATGIVVPFKTLLDLVPNVSSPDWGKALADLKTARDASEYEFKKAVHRGFYDWQAAIYRDCYVAATGEDRVEFLYAVQENTPPYETALWGLGCDWLADARVEVIQALEFYCSCLATNTWPGYRASEPVGSYGALSREAHMLRDIPRPIVTAEPKQSRPIHEQEIVP
jgi:hypothetical protein